MIISGNNTQARSPQLTLGPLLFNWPTDKIRDFYFKMADESPLDVVCLGEVVCSKRFIFQTEYLQVVLERLLSAKKQIIFSSLALVMDEAESASVCDLAKMAEDYLIEANDLSAVDSLSGNQHAIGPFINTYNEGSLAFFESKGAIRVSLPSELNGESIEVICQNAKQAAIEVQVFGRLPLAISARCYHARYHHKSKDTCQFVCQQDTDGKTVCTLEDKPFLAINGTQTLSHTYVNLVEEFSQLRNMGVKSFRVSPQDVDMVKVLEIFHDVKEEKLSGEEGSAKLTTLLPGTDFSNGFFHQKPGCEKVGG